jgi:hypothetical protein
MAVVAGLVSIGVGVDVAYSGLESGFQQIASPGFQILMLVFAIGVVVAPGAPAGARAVRVKQRQ